MDLSNALIVYGPLGIGVVAEAIVIMHLYKRTQDLSDKINAIQETRIQDARETRDRIGDKIEDTNRIMSLFYDKLRNDSKGA